jgi:hypothetical protein
MLLYIPQSDYTNHHTYQLRILKQHYSIVEELLNDLCIYSIKPIRNYKNTILICLAVRKGTLPYQHLHTRLRDLFIPFTLKGILATKGKNHRFLDETHEFTTNRHVVIDWFEQEERYKVFQLLRLTG